MIYRSLSWGLVSCLMCVAAPAVPTRLRLRERDAQVYTTQVDYEYLF